VLDGCHNHSYKPLPGGSGSQYADCTAAVIGGNAAGVKHQTTESVNGYLVDNIDEPAERIRIAAYS